MGRFDRRALVIGVALAGGLGATLGATMRAPQVAVVSSAQGAAALDNDLATAETLALNGKPTDARSMFERALETARASGLEKQQARALTGLAELFYWKNQDAPARENALRGAALYERLADPAGVGRTLHLLGLLAQRAGDDAEARSHFTRAIAAFETAGNPRARAMAALGLMQAGDESEVLLERALQDARSLHDGALIGRVLHSWGDRLFTTGQYEPALEKLEEAAAAFEEAGDRIALGTVYNSLGRLYRRHGRVNTALSYQLKALALHEKTTSTFNQLQSLNAVAVTYQSLGDARQARAYFDRALALAETSSSLRVQDMLRANLASTLMDEGDYVRAARTLEQVLERGADAYPTVRYAALSSAYLRLGRRADALAAARKAVDVCGRPSGISCLYALDQRAEAFAAVGDDKAALSDIRAALDTIEAVRSQLVPADFFKQEFNHAQEDIYSRAIAMQLAEGDDRSALTTAELSRSRAFIDLLASRDMPLKHRGSTAPSSGATTSLTFRGPVSKDRRAPGSLDLPSAVTAAPATASELSGVADRLHSTLLVYWVMRDQLCIWVVKPGGAVRSARVPLRASKLAALVHETTALPGASGAQAGNSTRRPASPRPVTTTRGAAAIALETTHSPAWRQLYDLLIRPVRGDLPHPDGSLVTIVPHGPLAAVAFAALQNERGRYLLEDYTLHYVPAGAVLQFTERKRRPDARSAGDVLLVSDPSLPVRSRLDQPLPRLPGARTETRAIARLIPAGRVTTFQDAGATESRIRTAAPHKAVLHFATHAIVRDDDPLGSFLAVGSDTAGRSGDGLLTAEEIYGLDLDADLVVLSACRSAGGRVTGDGIATFARAFIYAGTPSLVASLWDVADEPTNRLLPDFYRAWLGGASKARALRSAQLRLLRDLRANKVQVDTPVGPVFVTEHPVFWAGFSLIGEPD